MFFRFWSRLQSRVRARRNTGRRGLFTSEGFMSSLCAGGDAVPTPIAAFPAHCPLCDKDCALETPRCKHGAAFVRFLRAERDGARRV
ncbi:MAG: hypothetical protein LBF93_08515 [Zoogloeaceae bacterium]|jgi:hypothetical protein|nr:hypothetical protein [Zoogloeaceae bacterium]